MEDKQAELLEDAITLLAKMKNDRRMWEGFVGLRPDQREDINNLTGRYAALKNGG